MSDNTSSSEENDTNLEHFDDLYALQVLPAILCLAILMLVGAVGNSLVLYIYIAKFKTTTTSYFVSALAFLDLFNCLVDIPFEIADMRYNFTFGNSPLCKIMPLLVTFVSMASGTILVAVAIDRFRKICRPFQRQTTLSTAKGAIAVCCTLAAVVSLPAVFLYGPRVVDASEDVSGSECNVSDKSRQTLLPVIYNGIQFLLFVSTTVTLIVLYSMIWRQLSIQRRFRKAMSPMRHPQMKGILNKDSSSDTTTTLDKTLSSSTNADLNTVAIDHLNVSVGSRTNEVPSEAVGKPGQENSVFRCDKICSKSSKEAKSCKSQDKSVQKTTMMLFLITVVFILSFLPHLGLMAANAVNKQLYDGLHGSQVAAYNLFQRSYFINSASNPLVYSFCSDSFRRQLKLLFKKT